MFFSEKCAKIQELQKTFFSQEVLKFMNMNFFSYVFEKSMYNLDGRLFSSLFMLIFLFTPLHIIELRKKIENLFISLTGILNVIKIVD